MNNIMNKCANKFENLEEINNFLEKKKLMGNREIWKDF